MATGGSENKYIKDLRDAIKAKQDEIKPAKDREQIARRRRIIEALGNIGFYLSDHPETDKLTDGFKRRLEEIKSDTGSEIVGKFIQDILDGKEPKKDLQESKAARRGSLNVSESRQPPQSKSPRRMSAPPIITSQSADEKRASTSQNSASQEPNRNMPPPKPSRRDLAQEASPQRRQPPKPPEHAKVFLPKPPKSPAPIQKDLQDVIGKLDTHIKEHLNVQSRRSSMNKGARKQFNRVKEKIHEARHGEPRQSSNEIATKLRNELIQLQTSGGNKKEKIKELIENAEKELQKSQLFPSEKTSLNIVINDIKTKFKIETTPTQKVQKGKRPQQE